MEPALKKEIPATNSIVITKMGSMLKQSESIIRGQVIQISTLRWCFVFFVISGFCGLVYEVVWVRLAMASFGVTTALVSIVIAMFMAGLGLGSWVAGILTRRVAAIDGTRALRLYSVAELMIGISSLAVPLEFKLGRFVLQHMGSFGAWQSSRYYFLAGILIAITLMPWCTCMGSTFPLLMSVIRQTARAASERSFSYLYVANVLGALLGTLATAFVLIELLGFQGTLYVAGTLNAMLAILAFTISFSVTSSRLIEKPHSAPVPRPNLYGLPRGAVLFLLFTTGLVSMGMEVVWIRLFTPYLGNVVYAFAGILAVYLLATVVGSRDYRSSAQSRHHGESASAWSFLALFAVIPVVAADPLMPLWGDYGGWVRLSVIVLFCAMAGYLTPLLVDSWSSGDPDRAGTAYAVNIAGSIVGPLVSGFGLLPLMGERWAIAALSIPLFAIAALVAFRKASETPQLKSGLNLRLKFALATVVAILLFSVSHDFETIFPVREVRRDYAATVIADGTGFYRQLRVNGVGMTSLTPITKFISDLPLAFMARPPKNGLVICFGMGTSFRSMLSWGIPTTAVDLIPSVPKMFGYFHDDAAKVASSPSARIVIDDGRRFLDGSNQTFDVIVVDPPPPTEAAGSSLLYSREFYEVVKKHLNHDGILQAWYPGLDGDTATTASVTKAVMQAFPYVRAFESFDGSGVHFLASMEPIPVTSPSVLAARMPSAAAEDFVEWGPQATPEQQFDIVLSRELTLESLVAKDPRAPAMRDDQPINEYYLLRRWFHFYR
jgi:predicted membrane-bound spermidine synthase